MESTASTVATGSKAGRVLLGIGGSICVFCGVVHTIAHILSPKEARDATEKQMWELMQSYKIPVPWGTMTLWNIQTGYSLHYAISLAGIGLIVLMMIGPMRRDPVVQWRLSLLCTLIVGGWTFVAITYFFSIPIALEGAATVAFFLAAMFSAPKR